MALTQYPGSKPRSQISGPSPGVNLHVRTLTKPVHVCGKRLTTITPVKSGQIWTRPCARVVKYQHETVNVPMLGGWWHSHPVPGRLRRHHQRLVIQCIRDPASVDHQMCLHGQLRVILWNTQLIRWPKPRLGRAGNIDQTLFAEIGQRNGKRNLDTLFKGI